MTRSDTWRVLGCLGALTVTVVAAVALIVLAWQQISAFSDSSEHDVAAQQAELEQLVQEKRQQRDARTRAEARDSYEADAERVAGTSAADGTSPTSRGADPATVNLITNGRFDGLDG